LSLTVSSEPSVEPLSLADAKTHLRVTTTASDDYITALVTVARKHVENVTGRALITQTLVYTLAELDDRMPLPRAPVASISSVKLYSDASAATTVGSGVYTTSSSGERVSVVREDDESWPTVTLRSFDPVEVTFVAGYGASASDVPAGIVHAIKLLVGHWFENREPVVVGTITAAVPLSVDALLAPYTLRGF